MDASEIKHFIEAALLAAGRPLTADQLRGLFDGRSAPDKSAVRGAIEALNEDYAERGILVAEVASGYRLQIRPAMASRLHKLWEQRAPRYSRALFETLALVAYRQPITRGEIEDIRGVSVSSNIVRTLLEREWIRVVGHRDVPGRPAMFGTTKAFLDYFGLKKLEDLPPLADLSDWESLRLQLDLPEVDEGGEETELVATAEIRDLPVAHAGRARAGDEEAASAGDSTAPQADAGEEGPAGADEAEPAPFKGMAALRARDEEADAASGAGDEDISASGG